VASMSVVGWVSDGGLALSGGGGYCGLHCSVVGCDLAKRSLRAFSSPAERMG
jgi:hypothetical protein